MSRAGRWWSTLRTWHRPMLVLAFAMSLLAVVSAVGMLVDDRVLLGVSVWMKPFKFGLSMAIFGATTAWLLSLPTRARRTIWLLGALVAAILLVDVGIVAYYAAQGTLSHFNTTQTPLDQNIGLFLGMSISLMFVVAVLLAVVLAFQRVGGRALSTAIRTGFALTVAGMGLGYLMVFDNPKDQLIHDANGRLMLMPAGHSVGVPDGGPGVPVLGWSTTGGDLRVPHFVGIHGLQAMLALALLLVVLSRRVPRLVDERVRARLIGVAASAYAGLLALVSWQALRGQPLFQPDWRTLLAFAALIIATASGAALGLRTRPPTSLTADVREVVRS